MFFLSVVGCFINYYPADKPYENQLRYRSDFVTKSNGESWDSTWEKLWVPVLNHCIPVKKDNESLGLYVTTQLWITVYWNRNKLLLLSSTTKLKEIYLVKQQPQKQPQKSHKQDNHQNIFSSINQSLSALNKTYISVMITLHLSVRDSRWGKKSSTS